MTDKFPLLCQCDFLSRKHVSSSGPMVQHVYLAVQIPYMVILVLYIDHFQNWCLLYLDIDFFHPGEDLTKDKDGGVLRSCIQKGHGYQTPNEGASVEGEGLHCCFSSSHLGTEARSWFFSLWHFEIPMSPMVSLATPGIFLWSERMPCRRGETKETIGDRIRSGFLSSCL